MIKLALCSLLLLACKPTTDQVDAAIALLDATPVDATAADAVSVDATVVDASPFLDAPLPGGVILTINLQGQSQNCSLLTGMTLEVTDAAGNCLAADFVDDAAAGTTECPNPVPIACLEIALNLSIRPLNPGGYHALIGGLEGSTLCYSGDASIGIVEGTSTAQNLTLTPTGDCQ